MMNKLLFVLILNGFIIASEDGWCHSEFSVGSDEHPLYRATCEKAIETIGTMIASKGVKELTICTNDKKCQTFGPLHKDSVINLLRQFSNKTK